jgi:HEAT repeat protein
MYSAEALGNIGPVAADTVPAIKKLLKDDSEYVRKAAQEAIKKIRQE